jgi:heme/copper-type cytochrome/quinol oxidase subunit 3
MSDRNVLGMALFLASEAVFFVFLIIGYVYFSGVPTAGAMARSALDPRVTGLYTVALVASSVTVWRAAAPANRNRSSGSWVLATAALGAIFLVGQGREYARLLGANVRVSRGLFGTTFFTLTGFHGFHVLVGVVLLALVWVVGRLDGRTPGALDAVAWYWHFVDVVWIVIFGIVYVRPFL